MGYENGGCDFCDGKPLRDEHPIACVVQNDKLVIVDGYGERYEIIINHCPVCGRLLREAQ